MPTFDLRLPARRTTSVIFSSPHSGQDYEPHFLKSSLLDAHAIRSSEDAFVDRLFEAAPEFGAPLLAARAPRAYVDLNRSVDELDPAVVEGIRRGAHNPRVASGLGVIPRVVSNGRAIYRGKLPYTEARQRLLRTWYPYHEALQNQIDQSHRLFGEAILIDCHSMPHEAVDCISRAGVRRPDVVLGDRFGAAATPEIVTRVEDALTRAGLRVVRNSPFAGAYIAQHYGRPSRRQHAIQIEIDRALYMDEARIEPRPDFDAFCNLITGVIADVSEIGRSAAPLAAE
ncbi:N-formylglutamate amidohydrolase [Pseudooceanicola sp. C21-150M6]|uniref:N-formylglutamate amidohydrolase n=1 Tax=Pseudooceanicola sp. C21-150M6 TaxID=3434355 RepID=UPI003D7F4F4D